MSSAYDKEGYDEGYTDGVEAGRAYAVVLIEKKIKQLTTDHLGHRAVTGLQEALVLLREAYERVVQHD